jgi:hypothetical protein
MSKPIKSFTFWNGQSLSATVHGPPISMHILDNAGLTLNTSNVTSNTGTFKVEGTNDEPLDSFGNQLAVQPVWFDIGVSGLTLANTDATLEPNINQFPWKFLRVSFAPAGVGPNGTVTGKFYGKGV